MFILWIILAVAFLVVEFGTVALISLWFVVGSIAALIASLLDAALWVQVLLFALVSLLMLLLLRPFLRRYVDPHKVPTNVDAIIGREGLVTETIDNIQGTGAVKIGGMTWTARTEDGSALAVETVVKVRAVEGVKLIVTPVAK